MTDKDLNSIFNIGAQHGNISNVAGDMTTYGDQQYIATLVGPIRQELANLRQVTSAMRLDPAVEGSVRKLLADAERGLDLPDHDKKKIARPMERLARLLRDAGAISAGGAALIDPLQRIAAWLGTSGQAILHLIR